MTNIEVVNSYIESGTPVLICTDYAIKTIVKKLTTEKTVVYANDAETVKDTIDNATADTLVVVQDSKVDWESTLSSIKNTKASVLVWKALAELESEEDDNNLYVPNTFGKVIPAYIFIYK